jgi:methylglutaconyl-CoA hydratase
MPLVTCEQVGTAAIITLDRADKRNALSRALIAELGSAIEGTRDNVHVRTVILAARGPVFCAGMDLSELQESLEQPSEKAPVWNDALQLAQLYDRIYTLPKPTIAAVQGPAVAGGAGLVTVCDLAVAAPEASFGYPEVRRGLVAAMVMPHLLRPVTERMARYLLLTGEMIDAPTARTAGLINEVVGADQLLPRALAIAAALAAGGPQALAKTKNFIQMFSRQALSVEDAAKGSAEPRLTDECRHGLQAFFAKQSPPWLESRP